MTNALVAERLSKRYRTGATVQGYRSMRDAVSPRRRARREAERTLWALQDVSFEIAEGSAVGIIGRNGAGKTTLLKVLSRITEPTSGRAVVRGRVASLLEVGTGFHPELTGRENVYLNGAILGMRRGEIAAKFDEIVAFAELERFMDTPVKRYSSGMAVRLAFAVAAHLDAEILLVDEVLAVGDLGFQRKCLGKMEEQTLAEGRTVLFVSHQLPAIKRLTQRCIWLDAGEIKEDGPTDEIYRRYTLSYAAELGGGRADLSDLEVGRPAGKDFRFEVTFEGVELLNVEGRPADVHFEGEPVVVRVQLRCRTPLGQELEILSRLHTVDGIYVFSALGGKRPVSLEPGVYETSFTIDPNPLRPGTYQLELYCLTALAQDLLPAAITFRIEPNPQPGDDPRYSGPIDLGLVRLDLPWTPLEPVGEREPVEQAG